MEFLFQFTFNSMGSPYLYSNILSFTYKLKLECEM